MPSSPPAHPPDPDIVYRFLDWQAESASNRLIRNGIATHVTPRAMDVLVYFLRSGGRVVSKRELLDEIWHGQAVTDDALVVIIYELRKALGDRARQPTYLQTIVRRGYRFLPPVETTAPTSPAEASRATTDPETRPPLARPKLRRSWIAAILTCAAAAYVLGVGTLAPSPSNINDGEMSLGNTGAARDALLIEARQDLDLRTEPSLERAEKAYRILVESSPVDAGAKAGLARVAALRADLQLGDRFRLYHEARAQAEQALALDPEQADAHLALTTVQMILEWDGAAAARSVATALGPASQDPDVHQVRSWLLSARGDHMAAEKSARLATALAPSSASKRADLSFVLVIGGNFEAALTEAENALTLDPSNFSGWGALIRTHLATGDLETALHAHLEMLKQNDTPADTLEQLRQFGEHHGYWAFVDHLFSQVPSDQALVPRAAALAHLGHIDRALGLLERATERRNWEVLWLEQLPELRPLRDQRRFRDLLELRGPLQ